MLDFLGKPLTIPRAKKFGGPMTYHTFYDLKGAFFNKNLHPMDFKGAISDLLCGLLAPMRRKFESEEMQQLLRRAYS